MSVMLSGAALMDGSLLVIAANEPVPQPQTKEHLQALKMIGIKNIVVVQNKVDLVTYDQALNNYNKIVEFLSSFGYNQVPIIPVSAQKKLNVDALLQAIEEYIPTPPRNPDAPALMQVLRSFDINKPALKFLNSKEEFLVDH
jgi:Translation initiation factor 2, gamma subunit (eIF-2gamma; GTPase)